MFAPTESGSIEVNDGILIYRSSHYGEWWLPLSTIRQIEEYTLPDGPLPDDYFYRFTTGSKEERTASFYAVGWDEVWPELSRIFPGLKEPGLCSSTERIVQMLWPT